MLNKKKSSDLPPQKEEANNIDRHFNRHLADLEAEPPPNGWQNINARIKVKASDKVIDLKVVPWKKYVAVAAAVATVVVAISLSIPSGKEINSMPVMAERSTDKPTESVIVAPTQQHSTTTTLLPETISITAVKNIRPSCTNVVTLRKIAGKPIDPTLFFIERVEIAPKIALSDYVPPLEHREERTFAEKNRTEPQPNPVTTAPVKSYPSVLAFFSDKVKERLGIKTQTDPKAKKQTYEWNTDWLSIRHTQTIGEDE